MNNLSVFKWSIGLSLYFILFSCSNTTGNRLPNPEIKDGVAKVSVKITNFYPENQMLTLSVSHPVIKRELWITDRNE